jgi:4-amino-4-deoxy-L-arabinose transferase-like glycosyltransferase
MASPRNRPPSAPVNAPVPAKAAAAPATVWPDLILGGLLALLTVFFLHLSWRKWPDPMIDFGREVYLPWRISQGAVLYRDLQHMYGPFSPYFNSLVFRIGGVSLGSLIAANLVIYAGILALLYYFLRTGWSRLAAFVCCAVFVSVFSFSHLVGIGNYNFITPYAHEATHGILLVLLLIWALLSTLGGSRRWTFFAVGLLTGTAVLMKPEIMLATGAVLGGAFLLLIRDRFRCLRGPGWAVKILLLAVGGFLPMLLAASGFHFGAGLSWDAALRDANNAWLNVLTYAGTGALGTPMQKASMGTDNLTGNLLHELLAGGLALAFAGAAAWGSRDLSRWGKGAEVFGAIFLVIAAVLVGSSVPWLGIASIIPVLLLCGLAIEAVKIWRQPLTDTFDRQTAVRLLLWLAGLAFLFRMLFNPRVFHYGFFQAPIAMLVALATVLVALPEFLRVTGYGRKLYQAVITVLAFWGAAAITIQSARILSAQTLPVGAGSDQFLAFDPQKTGMPSGALVEIARQYLANDSGAHSLLVIPEGVMLNYLTRLPDPISNYQFDADLIAVQGNRTMRELQATPPDRIVLITRDLREYGIARFGDSPENGSAMLDFIAKNYDLAYHQGGDPLDPNVAGVIVYALRPGYVPPAAK